EARGRDHRDARVVVGGFRRERGDRAHPGRSQSSSRSGRPCAPWGRSDRARTAEWRAEVAMSDVNETADAALPSPLHLPHAAASCPKCLANADHEWWSARPEGARLVGLVVAREGMPSVTEQRKQLTRFGVPIEGFRHPAPEILESWGDRLTRLL